ncbi:MAG: M50 family metallopeptidase [Chloroflexota bacterium]|nr:M50 family metallopeptidase [Chloroflexota bacterium]
MSSILQLVIAVSALIILHELGHFLAARLLKVEVEEFGLGIPPRLLTLFKLGKTEYTLNWLPLGGFVRLKGENDANETGGLQSANPWARLAIYIAGPIMNLLIGILIYAVIFTQTGAPDPTQVLVIDVAAESPAAQAGLAGGDIITYAAGQDIDSMSKLHDTIYAHLEENIDVTYKYGDESHTVSLTPRENPPEGEGSIGIIMSNPVYPIGWLESIPMGAQATYYHTLLLITLPGKIIRGAIAPELARPVGYKGMYDIYQDVKERETIAPESPINLNALHFFATITISLGMINLMPIPALDGGRILFTLPEILLRRRIPQEWQNIINTISFAAMMLLFVYINILDFTNPIEIPK